MVFVDGENFALRGADVLKESEVSLGSKESEYHCRNVLWMPEVKPRTFLSEVEQFSLKPKATRATYYTTTWGSSEIVLETKRLLNKMGFSPRVFRKANKQKKCKGVDVALTLDFLSHAYQDNYDIAVLVSGDGDFLPVVQEVKRLGKQVILAAFENGLNKELQYECDEFVSLNWNLEHSWRRYLGLPHEWAYEENEPWRPLTPPSHPPGSDN